MRIVAVAEAHRGRLDEAKELIAAGAIGKVLSVRMQSYRNIMPGFGTPADSDPPPELDWNAFLGPAPARPYNRNRGLYHFRWFWDYSGGQMTNLGAHSLDIADWYLGGKAPLAVASFGGRYALLDNGETPDTQDTLFQFPGWTAVWSHREASRGAREPGRDGPVPGLSGLEFFGTHGSTSRGRAGRRRGIGAAAVLDHGAVGRFR